MFKRIILVVAIMAVLVGTLLAQPMMHHAKRQMVEGKGMNAQYMNQDNCGRMGMGKGMGMHHQKGQGKMNKMVPGRMILSMAEELELSETQISNIKEIQGTFHKESNLKEAEIENLSIDKREAMQNQNFKEASKLTKNIFKLKEELALARISVMENIHKELTKEQIEKLKTNCKMD